jgi:hypothetical protein
MPGADNTKYPNRNATETVANVGHNVWFNHKPESFTTNQARS